MREKLETLPLTELRELAKASGVKGISGKKKNELIDAILEKNEENAKKEVAQDTSRETVAEASTDANRRPADAGERRGSSKSRVVIARGNADNRRNSESRRPVDSRRNAETIPMQPAESFIEKAVETRMGEEPLVYQKPAEDRAGLSTETTAELAAGSDARSEARSEAKSVAGSEAGSAAESEAEAGPVSASSGEPVAGTRENGGAATVSDNPIEYAPKPNLLEGAEPAAGIFELCNEGYGFIRSANFLPGDDDIYVSPAQIRKFGLRTGDILTGMRKAHTGTEKFCPLVFLKTVNGFSVQDTIKRASFEHMTPIFPDERIKLEVPGCSVAMRAVDLVSPVGKGQRGMIVSPPKAGKTTLLKEVARSILMNQPKMHMLILLIDERPEEVTDIKEAIIGENVEVIYSTFDETPEHHVRVSEMVIERARRLVEHHLDVVILLDSITRLTRAYNQVVPPSGRTLSGGLDPAALHMPKRFFGAARNMREGGSLTILATALVETGSKMDDVVYEEFKGTGNMEIVLDRKLSEKRIFPAIDLAKSGTRREDLLLSTEELEAINVMRKSLNSLKPEEATDRILDMFSKTRSNFEFVQTVKKNRTI